MKTKKYLYAAKTVFLSQAAYPTRFFALLFADGIPLLIYLFLWKTIFATQSNVKGYTLPMIVTYYAITFTIRELTDSKTITKEISSHIRSGDLSNFLIKPVDFNIFHFSKVLTKKSVASVFPIIFLILLFTFFKEYFLPPHNTGLFVVSLVFGALIAHFIFSILGLIAFWTVNTWGIVSIFGRFASIASGSVFPLDFLPNWALELTKFFPFQYMTYIPAAIYIDKISSTEAAIHIVIQLIWIIGLAGVYKILWGKALKRYDAVGQ